LSLRLCFICPSVAMDSGLATSSRPGMTKPTLRRPFVRVREHPFPVSFPGEWSVGRRQGAALRRPCGAPVRYAGQPSAPCKDGIASPIPRRARAVIWRRAKPRHRTAAPPCAPPADPACAASAPKDFGLISGPSFGLSRPARHLMRAPGQTGKGYLFTICSQECCQVVQQRTDSPTLATEVLVLVSRSLLASR
jgi:hypothetical protein